MTLSETILFVNAMAPVDINGGKDTAIVNMQHYKHCTFLCKLGVVNAGFDGVATLNKGVNTTTADVPIAGRYRVCSSGDTWSEWKEFTSSGLTIKDGGDIDVTDSMFLVEFDNAELSPTEENHYVTAKLSFTDGGQSALCDVTAIMSESSYKGINVPSAL